MSKTKTKVAKDAEEFAALPEQHRFVIPEGCHWDDARQRMCKTLELYNHRYKMERSDFSEIVQKLRDFNRERDWEQFHDAKNLALSISIEASELNECFLWKNAEEANRAKVEEELADVFLCAIMLADKYGIDIKDVCLKKIERNAQKYPVEKAKGKATKYNEL